MVQNGHIILEDCFVPDKNKLAKCIDFATSTKEILRSCRLSVAWGAAGTACGAYEAALEYTQNRTQFGKKIVSFQLVQEMLMQSLAKCQSIVSYLVRATQLNEQGKMTAGQIGLAKAYATQTGRDVVKLCREACGGNGILLENRVGKALLDMEGIHTYEGTY